MCVMTVITCLLTTGTKRYVTSQIREVQQRVKCFWNPSRCWQLVAFRRHHINRWSLVTLSRWSQPLYVYVKGKKLKKKENWRGETHYQTTPEKFQNSAFTLKTLHVFHIKPVKFETANHRWFSDLCLRKTWTGKSHCSRDVIVFKELRFQFFFLSSH